MVNFYFTPVRQQIRYLDSGHPLFSGAVLSRDVWRIGFGDDVHGSIILMRTIRIKIIDDLVCDSKLFMRRQNKSFGRVGENAMPVSEAKALDPDFHRDDSRG